MAFDSQRPVQRRFWQVANVDVLTYGFALMSDQGAFGYSTNSLRTIGSQSILVDTGPSSRWTLLYRTNGVSILQTR